MAWRQWEGYSYPHGWATPKKKTWKEDKKGKDKGPYLVAYDGRKLPIGSAKDDGRSGPSSVASSPSTSQEVRQIRQQVKAFANTMAEKGVDVPESISEFCRTDPLEDLREQQRELNARRKKHTRMAKLNTMISEKQITFQTWKDSIGTTVLEEETRHQEDLRKLQQDLHMLEHGPKPKSEDDEMGELSCHKNDEIVQMMKLNMQQQQMTNTMLMKQQEALQQQLQQLTSVFGMVMGGPASVAMGQMNQGACAPQPIPAAPEVASGLATSASTMGPGNTETGKGMLLPTNAHKEAWINSNLSEVSDSLKKQALEIIFQDPSKYDKSEVIYDLIQGLGIANNAIQSPVEVDADAGTPRRDAMQPFGKAVTPRQRSGPYHSPAEIPMSTPPSEKKRRMVADLTKMDA